MRHAPIVLIVAGTLVAFLPCLKNELVWDDRIYLADNHNLRGLSAESVRWMFRTRLGGDYQPVTWLSWGLDQVLWGSGPRGHHFGNLVLHIAGAVTLYFVCCRLYRPPGVGGSAADSGAVRWSACAAAMLFAVHPLRVEAVAWAANRAYVLPGFLGLLSVWLYLRYGQKRPNGRSRTGRAYAGSLAFFVLSLLSTPIAMGLPVVLLILDVYPLQRLTDRAAFRRLLLEKVPFLIAGLIVGVVAMASKSQAGALSDLSELGLRGRLALAAYNLAFHLRASFWPVGLSPLYVMPVGFDPTTSRFVMSGTLVVGVTAVLLVFRRRLPDGLAGWLAYVVLLLPMAGFVQHGVQMAADRSGYLACAAVAVLAGGVLGRILATARRRSAGAASAVTICVVLVLGVLTNRQTRVWRDSETLWRRAIDRDESCYVAYYNLGTVWSERGKFEGAEAQFRRALEIHPGYADAANNLGNTLQALGRTGEAMTFYAAAIAADPAHDDAYNNLGLLLSGLGRLDEAEQHLRRALEIRADHPLAHNNLGDVLLRRGDRAEAIAHYLAAVQADPEYVTARNNLGQALLAAGRVPAAMEQLRQVLRREPTHVAARNSLAVALIRLGRYGQAAEMLREGLELVPGSIPLTANLARLLATSPKVELRDVAAAEALIDSVADRAGVEDPQLLYAAAAVYRAAGRNADCSRAARQAYELAVAGGDTVLAQRIRSEFAALLGELPASMPVGP